METSDARESGSDSEWAIVDEAPSLREDDEHSKYVFRRDVPGPVVNQPMGEVSDGESIEIVPDDRDEEAQELIEGQELVESLNSERQERMAAGVENDLDGNLPLDRDDFGAGSEPRARLSDRDHWDVVAILVVALVGGFAVGFFCGSAGAMTGRPDSAELVQNLRSEIRLLRSTFHGLRLAAMTADETQRDQPLAASKDSPSLDDPPLAAADIGRLYADFTSFQCRWHNECVHGNAFCLARSVGNGKHLDIPGNEDGFVQDGHQALGGQIGDDASLTLKPTNDDLAPELSNRDPAGLSVAPELSNQDLAGLSLAPELSNQDLAGLSLAPELSNQDPAGLSVAPELSNQDLAGLSLAPELSNQDLAGLSLAPELSNQDLAGLSLAPELSNRDPAGLSVAPELSNQDLAGLSLAPELSNQDLAGLSLAPELSNQDPAGLSVATELSNGDPPGLSLAPGLSNQDPVDSNFGKISSAWSTEAKLPVTEHPGKVPKILTPLETLERLTALLVPSANLTALTQATAVSAEAKLGADKTVADFMQITDRRVVKLALRLEALSLHSADKARRALSRAVVDLTATRARLCARPGSALSCLEIKNKEKQIKHEEQKMEEKRKAKEWKIEEDKKVKDKKIEENKKVKDKKIEENKMGKDWEIEEDKKGKEWKIEEDKKGKDKKGKEWKIEEDKKGKDKKAKEWKIEEDKKGKDKNIEEDKKGKEWKIEENKKGKDKNIEEDKKGKEWKIEENKRGKDKKMKEVKKGKDKKIEEVDKHNKKERKMEESRKRKEWKVEEDKNVKKERKERGKDKADVCFEKEVSSKKQSSRGKPKGDTGNERPSTDGKRGEGPPLRATKPKGDSGPRRFPCETLSSDWTSLAEQCESLASDWTSQNVSWVIARGCGREASRSSQKQSDWLFDRAAGRKERREWPGISGRWFPDRFAAAGRKVREVFRKMKKWR